MPARKTVAVRMLGCLEALIRSFPDEHPSWISVSKSLPIVSPATNRRQEFFCPNAPPKPSSGFQRPAAIRALDHRLRAAGRGKQLPRQPTQTSVCHESELLPQTMTLAVWPMPCRCLGGCICHLPAHFSVGYGFKATKS
jgi:hypothetical protein